MPAKRKRVNKADDFPSSNSSLRRRLSDSDEVESRGARSSQENSGGRKSQLKNGQSQGDGNSQKGVKDFGIPNHQKSSDDDDDDNEDVILLYKPKGVNLLMNVPAKGNGAQHSDKKASEEDLSLLNELANGNAAMPKPKASAEPMAASEGDLSLLIKLVHKKFRNMDVLVKARTATGKTVAFLLIAIEAIVKKPIMKSPSVDGGQKSGRIYVLVICPTQELAIQTAIEADILLQYHPTIGVQVLIGGINLSTEQERLQANPCQILIATPGSLRDHTENTAGFATRLMGVKLLVLDEADQLLDMGFRKDIERIVTLVPYHRRTLLFSPTVPPKVFRVCHIALRKGFKYINTMEKGSQDTHPSQVIVFCTTAMIARLVFTFLSELKMNVVHSRKKQKDEFWKSKGLILVTSDVFEREVDYPDDVILVIQLGMASDKEQYMARLGRTGQISKVGKGILLLAPYEESFLSKLRNVPITKASEPSVDLETRKEVEEALSRVDMKIKKTVYKAWLDFYDLVVRNNSHLLEHAKEFSRSMGLVDPPAIPKELAVKIGLLNDPGLLLEYNEAYNEAPKYKGTRPRYDTKPKYKGSRPRNDIIGKQIQQYKCFQGPPLLWPGAASFMAGGHP